jgi:hypothetical protein
MIGSLMSMEQLVELELAGETETSNPSDLTWNIYRAIMGYTVLNMI